LKFFRFYVQEKACVTGHVLGQDAGQ